jgi:hypothetical protein
VEEVRFLRVVCKQVGCEPVMNVQGDLFVEAELTGVDLYKLFSELKARVPVEDLLEQFSDASIREYMEKRNENL